MQRRNFVVLLGGMAVGWTGMAAAQRMRLIGVLMNTRANSSEGQSLLAAFRKRLRELGWNETSNVQLEVRWGANDAELTPRYAAELVALAPDVILASGTPGVTALQRATQTLPIVFVRVTDPLGAGFVDTMARPGGNITGFMLFEYSAAGKWLEILRQIAPRVARVAVLRDASNPAGIAQFGAIEAAAGTFGLSVRAINVREVGALERAVGAFAGSPNSGLIVTGSASTAQREPIIALAARLKLPAVYSDRFDCLSGGMVCYGPDRLDQYVRAAAYVDRILKGEKPAELPVQAPTKYQIVINRKTATALGIELPPSLLAAADEVIE